jgi:phospholipase/carboxylesterase
MAAQPSLNSLIRPAAEEPEGALVLLHGRGADEHDLFGLLDLLDPERRLVGMTPRGPLSLPPGGAHWYVVREVGYPDPVTFLPVCAQLSAWLDAALQASGVPPERLVLGGFSQGCVMAWAVGLGAGRPRPAGIVGLSGFMPAVDGFALDLTGLEGYPVAIGHGSLDGVISVEWGRRARDAMEEAGADVVYRETQMGHSIDPAFLSELQTWLGTVLS